MAVASVAVILVGCGGADDNIVAETHRSTEGQASQESSVVSSSLPTETMATSSTAPPPSRPTECGTTATPDGTEVAVTITTGWGACRDAVALIDIYYRDRPATTEDPTRALDIDGWLCASDATAEPGEVVTCALPDRSVVTAGTVG